MDQTVLGIVHHTIPYIQQQVHSKDMHIFYAGGKAFGYPEVSERHQLHVVHRNTLMNRWSVVYPGRTEVDLEVNAIALRKASGVFLSTNTMGCLTPLGELVYTAGGKCADLLLHLTSSAEYARALKEKKVFNSTYFYRTENIGYVYQHMYAHLVALRTALEGVVGVGQAIPLLALAEKYSNTAYDAVKELMEMPATTNFNEFAERGIAALKAEGVQVNARYD